MNHPDFPIEQTYLEDVLNFLTDYLPGIEAQKEEIDASVDYGLKHYNSDNSDQFIALTLNLSAQRSLAQKMIQGRFAMKKPYFARVDFYPDDEKGTGQAHYIGKMTLMRELSILITDWRAPIASLYYEGRMGQAAYDCPDGHITGEIALKRQIQIENGQLQGFTDIDITTNDDFLQAALGASKDRRLKDIVTTIQAEQNKIIRAPLFKPLIVQGAAGSGKTTIALHRIAYLLYAHEDVLNPHQVMIMAPNRFFLSYISDVLPDLGVDQVMQTTFSDFVASCLELNFKKWRIVPAMEAVADAINASQHKSTRMEAARLKSDLRFMAVIKRYCAQIEKECLPPTGFMVEGYEIFTHEAIVELFLHTYTYLPTDKRVKEIEKHLSNTLKREIPLIVNHIEAEYDRRRIQYKSQMPDSEKRRALIIALLDERDDILKQIKTKSKSQLKKYLRVFKLQSALTYYQALFADTVFLENLCHGLYTSGACVLIAQESQKIHKKGILEPEDLPPLLWMQLKLFGLDDMPEIKHIVIDEAQDCSLFQLAALKEAIRSDSFTILGDLHQGILVHKGIKNWDDACRLFPDECKPVTLIQSYRTTVEIMEAANPVITKLYPKGADPAVPLAVPVIRHGSPVEYQQINKLSVINETIAAWQEEGCRSIAVIGKTAKECKALQKALTLHPPIITEGVEEYEGGLLIVPVYLVKGLEFDGVIIADTTKYGAEPLDIKLLYIAMTRALHKLAVYTCLFNRIGA